MLNLFNFVQFANLGITQTSLVQLSLNRKFQHLTASLDYPMSADRS